MIVRPRIAASVVGLALIAGCGDDTSGSGGGGGSGTGGGATSGPGATSSSGSGSGSGASGTADGPTSSGSGANGSGSSSSESASTGTSSGTGGGAAWWNAPAGTSWQIQYVDYPLDRSFDVAMYDVDLVETSDADFASLRGDGRIVICYFSAGTWEPYRPDADAFPEEALGNAYDDPAFDDERYLDVTNEAVRELMKARLDLAAERGCDGVDPDNVNLDEVGEDVTGVPIGAAEQLAYSRFIAAEAHARGLSVGLKNSIEHAAELEPDFDWAVNEECFAYDECDVYASSFIAADKAVFHIEYTDEASFPEVCAVTGPLGLSSILKTYDLDAFRVGCDD